MYLRLQRGLSFGPLVAACVLGFAALNTAADARPSHAKRSLYSQISPNVMARGDTEFATTQMGAGYSGYVAAERPVTRRRARRVASIDPSAGMGSFGSSNLVSEARRWVGTNPTGRRALWCGHFMNFVLSRTGHRASKSNMARSFASYGTRLSGPQVGAIAVMSRGRGGGHVGIVTGIDSSGNPIIISGNHNRTVAEAVYPRGRILAYVAP